MRDSASNDLQALEGRNPRAVWVPRGTVHSDEGVGAAPRIYVFEIK